MFKKFIYVALYVIDEGPKKLVAPVSKGKTVLNIQLCS